MKKLISAVVISSISLSINAWAMILTCPDDIVYDKATHSLKNGLGYESLAAGSSFQQQIAYYTRNSEFGGVIIYHRIIAGQYGYSKISILIHNTNPFPVAIAYRPVLDGSSGPFRGVTKDNPSGYIMRSLLFRPNEYSSNASYTYIKRAELTNVSFPDIRIIKIDSNPPQTLYSQGSVQFDDVSLVKDKNVNL